jgi:hypothetical protein
VGLRYRCLCACETISVFGFTGIPPTEVVGDNAHCTLRDLHAVGITAGRLAAPPLPGVIAVRSSGYGLVNLFEVQWGPFLVGDD